MRKLLSRVLKRAGYIVFEADQLGAGAATARERTIDVALVDHCLPDGTALDFLNKTSDIRLATIVMSGRGSIALAVEAMRSGAEHFLTKPIERETLLVAIEKAVSSLSQARRLEASARKSKGSPDPFLGVSPPIRRLRELAEATVSSDAPVLILGETGTGKGVLARWLHENGPRAGHAYVDLNCAGLAPQLVESDLFGHERGAFTGAHVVKSGLLDVAHRGTLFLDEIGDLDPSVQPKLLKVLEEHSYRRVGGVTTREVDTRLIAATHKGLMDLVSAGRFRNDLLFRINTITFELPSLRERIQDLPLLTDAVLEGLCGARGAPPVTDAARACLAAHRWTGNLRELRNVLERALLFRRHDEIDESCLQLPQLPTRPQELARPRLCDAQDLTGTLVDAEVSAIQHALHQAGGQVSRAAQTLGIPRSSLYVKLKKYGIRAS